MTFKNLTFTLWSITLWAILLVISRIILLTYTIDPWSFTFIQLISGGIILIALSAGGEVNWQSLSRPSTWIYGILRVITAAAFTAALVHVSVVQAGLLAATNVTLSTIGVWIFFSRRPLPHELPGHLFIIIGVIVLILRVTDSFANPAVLLMFISELAVVSSSMIAEKHPDNNAKDPRARLRFTGVILLLTALLFLFLRLSQGLLNSSDTALTTNLGLFSNSQLWISGLLVGILLRGTAMHTSLKAIRLVGTETYLLLVVSLPFIGWGFEAIAFQLGWITIPAASLQSILPGIAIALGSLFIIFIRQKRTST